MKTIKSDFPIFENIPQLIYLDNAATTQKPKVMIERLAQYYCNENCNVHRASYQLGLNADKLFNNARESVRAFIDAKSSSEIIFTAGATDSLNCIASMLGHALLKDGDNIVITEMEHHANLLPWRRISKQIHAELRTIPVNTDGSLSMKSAQKLIDNRTKIVAVSMMSNVTGEMPNIDLLTNLAHNQNAIVVLDAAQAIQHINISVKNLDCDFLVFSGHKLYAPMGVGVLYGKQSLLNTLTPCRVGGDMVEQVTSNSEIYRDLPIRLEAGTPNLAGILGLQTSIEYLNSIDLSSIRKLEQELAVYTHKQLSDIKGITIIGKPDSTSPILSFVSDCFSPYDLGVLLGTKQIAVRSGTHCAQPYMNKIGYLGSCRISLGIYNTRADIDKLCNSLRKIQSR